MHRVAEELGMDPLDVIRRNLVPAGVFPYRAAAGALLLFIKLRSQLPLPISIGRGRMSTWRRPWKIPTWEIPTSRNPDRVGGRDFAKSRF